MELTKYIDDKEIRVNMRDYKDEVTKLKLGYGMSSSNILEGDEKKDYRIERIDIVHNNNRLVMYINGEYDSLHLLEEQYLHGFIRYVGVHLRGLLLHGVKIRYYQNSKTSKTLDEIIFKASKDYKNFSYGYSNIITKGLYSGDVSETIYTIDGEETVYKIISDKTTLYIYRGDKLVYESKTKSNVNEEDYVGIKDILDAISNKNSKIKIYYANRGVMLEKAEQWDTFKELNNEKYFKYTTDYEALSKEEQQKKGLVNGKKRVKKAKVAQNVAEELESLKGLKVKKLVGKKNKKSNIKSLKLID